MTAGEAREARAIPCGLLTGAKVLKPVLKGDLITTSNTAVPVGSKIVALRARQDEMLFGASGGNIHG